MIILGVSGGPDSMYLLSQYKHKKNIIVAHVNYNAQSKSNNMEKIVNDYCVKNKIRLEIKNVNFSGGENFENWARKIRLKFFEDLYIKNFASKVLLAHHKDDFLETALMQQESKRTPKYFGIRKKIVIDNMNIYRPFINIYWKSDILKFVIKDKVPYEIDPTNLDKKYSTRNKIRSELKTWPQKKKRSYYSWFKMSNKILAKKNKRINLKYRKWEKLDFKIVFFRNLKKYKPEIVFEIINNNYKNIKLSSNKINSIINFIESENGNISYKLDNKNILIKKSGKLLFT